MLVCAAFLVFCWWWLSFSFRRDAQLRSARAREHAGLSGAARHRHAADDRSGSAPRRCRELTAGRPTRAGMIWSEKPYPLSAVMLWLLAEHDLFRKPVSTFRDHALSSLARGDLHVRHRTRH